MENIENSVLQEVVEESIQEENVELQTNHEENYNQPVVEEL